MKISEQVLMEKEFPFYIYDKKGEVTETKTVILRELPSLVAASIRNRCTLKSREGQSFDSTKFGWIVGAKMIIDAPFESEAGIKWKEMEEAEKIDYLSKLNSTYELQLSKLVNQMEIHITEEEKNLS